MAAPVSAEAPVLLVELIDAYKATWAATKGRMDDAERAVTATPEWQRWKAAADAHAAREKAMLAVIKEKTGKVLNFQTGALGDVPATQ